MAAIARAFVAVEPPAAVCDVLDAQVRALRARGPVTGLRFGTSWHLTLQFLGRVDDVGPLVGALAGAVGASAPFFARLGGAGAFPRTRSGTVLWVGVDEGAADLGRLAAAVAGATEPLGVATDTRRFQPHVTLARSNRSRDLRALVDALGTEPAGPRWRVDDVVLLASDTRPDGARYTEVTRFPLRS